MACRICYGEDPPLLRGVCSCEGSVGFVHRKCMEDWLTASLSNCNYAAHSRCDVCRSEFQFGVRFTTEYKPLTASAVVIEAFLQYLNFLKCWKSSVFEFIDDGLLRAVARMLKDEPTTFALLFVLGSFIPVLLLDKWDPWSMLWGLVSALHPRIAASLVCAYYIWGKWGDQTLYVVFWVSLLSRSIAVLKDPSNNIRGQKPIVWLFAFGLSVFKLCYWGYQWPWSTKSSLSPMLMVLWLALQGATVLLQTPSDLAFVPPGRPRFVICCVAFCFYALLGSLTLSKAVNWVTPALILNPTMSMVIFLLWGNVWPRELGASRSTRYAFVALLGGNMFMGVGVVVMIVVSILYHLMFADSWLWRECIAAIVMLGAVLVPLWYARTAQGRARMMELAMKFMPSVEQSVRRSLAQTHVHITTAQHNLGITLYLDPTKARSHMPCIVADVTVGSASHLAGIREGDVITRINGHPVDFREFYSPSRQHKLEDVWDVERAGGGFQVKL